MDGPRRQNVPGTVAATLLSVAFILAVGQLALFAQRADAGERVGKNVMAGAVTSTPLPSITGTPTATPSGTAFTSTPSATPTPVCPPAWSLVTIPTLYPYQFVGGIAVISATDVWVVGEYSDTNPPNINERTLMMHWDGTQWSEISSPNPGTVNGLSAVAALSTDDVWAVGSYGDPTGGYHTLTTHWDGTQWSVVSSPDVSSYGNSLVGVVAISTDNVWAAGSAFAGYRNYSGPIIEHWDGLHWRAEDIPSPGPVAGLGSISAVSADDIWAVGGYSTSAIVVDYRTLTMHFDGSQWSIVDSPSPSVTYNGLSGVSALSANDVWAVGDYTLTDQSISLTMHWDGLQWSAVDSPNPGDANNQLAAVSAVSANDVWAVGGLFNSKGQDTHSIILHWDGMRWRAASPPNGGYLRSVAAHGADNVWAVGEKVLRYSTDLFSDVRPSDYFYQAVEYLYCHGAISGYDDGTFRPYSSTTRGQLAKIVVLGEGWAIDTSGGPHFSDVPISNPFYDYIETAYNRGIINGYADGTFRWGSNVTRAQLCKILVLAEAWPIDTHGGPHFVDVPENNPFYSYVETAYNRGIISGYADATFRPGSDATRGQISKIVYLSVTAP